MNTNPTYALIDNDSGFVWAIISAASPELACAAATLENGGDELAYESTYSLASNEGGYIVYAAPADFDVNDGQNAEEIAAVSAMPLIGKFRAI